ncbi:MAG: hypothetical protein KDC37_02660, partial [Flavobacteriales bacterium]|nr:hypothetical protein [Flavobacteriales bacterium]
MRNLLLKILNHCRRRPVLWTFLGATSALLVGAIIFITPWIEGELKRRLPALVHAQTQGNYTLEIVDIDLDLWRLNIEIQNVSLNFDTTRLASLPDTAWAINARLPALNLSLGNPLSWILHQNLFISFIGIDDLRVQVIQQGRSNTPWSAKRLRAMLQNILKKSLSSLTIEKIKWEISQTTLPGRGRLLHPFTVVANGFSITKAGTPKLAQIQVLSGRQQWQQHGAYALDSLIFDWQERKLQVQGLSITDLDSGNTEMYLPLLRMSDFNLQLLADSATLILDKLILQNPRWRSTTRLKDNHADTGQIKRLLPLTLPFKRLRISHVYLNQGNIGLSIHREGIEQTINAEGLSVRLQDFRIDTSATNTTSPISFFTHIRLMVKDLQYNIPEYKVKMEARQAEYSSKTKRLDLNGLHYIGHRNKMLSEIKAHRQLLYLSEFKARHIGITDLTAEALLTGKIQKVAMVSVRDPYLAIFLDSTRIEGASTDGSNRLPIPAITCNILKLENASVDLYNALKTGRKYGTARGVDINVSRLQTDIIRSGAINFLKSMQRFSFNIESLMLDTLGNIKTLSAKNMAYNSQTGKIGGQDVRLIWSNRQMEVSALGRLLEGEQFNLVKSLATRNLYANNLKLVGPEVEIRTSSSANLSSTNSIKTPGIHVGETEIQNGQFAVYRRDTTLLEAINLNAHLKGLMTAFDTLTKIPELQLQSGRISVDRINALLDKGGHKLTIGGIRATSSDSSLR